MPLTTRQITPQDTVNLWELFEEVRGWITTLANSGTSARYWTGYPTTKSTGDGKNVSVAMLNQIESVGGVAPAFSGDSFKLAAGKYRIDLQARFDQASGGYRTLSLLKNAGVTTYNSSSSPPGTYMRSSQVAASSNDTTAQLTWTGTLAATDELIVMVRQTSGSSTNVVGTMQDSALTVTRLGD